MKGKHVLTSDQKLEWFGNGEWVEEPDLVPFDHEGIECVVKRIIIQEWDNSFHMGHLCGYVRIPENHPWVNLNYGDIDVDVHGGLTYKHQHGDGTWIGFDCGHSMDLIPSIEMVRKKNPCMPFSDIHEKMKKKFPDSGLLNPTYKNINFVVLECKSLAEQVNKAMGNK